MEVVLTTERLMLRRFKNADVDALVELDFDPEVMRYISGGRPTSREEVTTKIIPSILARYTSSPGYGVWAAQERSTGDFVGWFELRPRPGGSPDEPELGYRLRRSAWGKGYATEGSRALVRKAFAELGAVRVYAETMAINATSRRVMEKAGLQLVRTWHQDWDDPIEGTERGEVQYALTREQMGGGTGADLTATKVSDGSCSTTSHVRDATFIAIAKTLTKRKSYEDVA